MFAQNLLVIISKNIILSYCRSYLCQG